MRKFCQQMANPLVPIPAGTLADHDVVQLMQHDRGWALWMRLGNKSLSPRNEVFQIQSEVKTGFLHLLVSIGMADLCRCLRSFLLLVLIRKQAHQFLPPLLRIQMIQLRLREC